ncbi:MAG: hypothetical protein JWM65_3524 [Sphingomonas bacterium]|nr:hypothetical protein [Sphingomonas bacterium]
MRRLFLLLAAIVASSLVPGAVVVVAMALVPFAPLKILGSIFLLPLSLPVAMIFGAAYAFVPAMVLGLSLYGASWLLAPVRPRLAWLAAGLVVGFCNVGRLGGLPNPFADPRAGCLAAACGATAMLAFHVIVQPKHLPPAAVPSTIVSRGAVLAVFLLASAATLLSPFRDRFAYAAPNHARILYPHPVQPASVTLYSYVVPQPYLGGATWRTTGHSITLRVRTDGTDVENSVEEWVTLPLSRSEIAASGGDVDAFGLSGATAGARRPAAYSPVNISIVRGTELEQLERLPGSLRDRTITTGERVRIDDECGIIWHWRENPGQPPQVDWARPSAAPGASVEGAPIPPLDPVRLYCSATSCGMSFPYRGMMAQASFKWASVCQWRNHKKAIVRALDRRLIRETRAY